jgi:ferritin-like metal-binding protein YciE
MQTAWELFIHELRDALNFENKLVHVLGEQARETSREALSGAFTLHRKQTEKHAERLIDIFRELGEVPDQSDCKGIDGLIEEKLALIKQSPSKGLLDYINVGAGIKVERYEISAYESLVALARQLGATRSAGLLQQTLAEERETLHELQQFSKQVSPSELGIKETPEGGFPRKAA